MRVIDLLNKIANREELPTFIKVRDSIFGVSYKFDGKDLDYQLDNEEYYLSDYICKGGLSLNDEVEIIEEKTKPITKESIEVLGYVCGEIQKCFTNGWNKSLENKPLTQEDKKIEKIDIQEKSIKVKGTIFYREKDIEIFQKLSMVVNEIIDKVNKGE